MKIVDNDGYFYQDKIMERKRFYIKNPYTIQNIKNWIVKNNKKFLILEEEYSGCSVKMKFQCMESNCQEIFLATWNTLQSGNGCPFCGKKQVGKSNCLATVLPNLIKEWDYERNGEKTPYNILAGHIKKVWWICSVNKTHRWQASPNQRLFLKAGCPCCSGRYPTEENNLALVYPELLKEWDYTKNKKQPNEYTPNSGVKVWWRCEKNHEWEAVIHGRNTRGCPFCAGLFSTDFNNLYVDNPILCEEWDYKKNNKQPKEYLPFSNKIVWWNCKKCGMNWKSQIYLRNKKLSGCPKCNKSKGENEISSILDKFSIYYESQVVYKDLLGEGNGFLSYDFFLPFYNMLIEYQGEQHAFPVDFCSKGPEKAETQFLKQQEHDSRKRTYAIQNNIPLLEIWYYDFDRIEEILSESLNISKKEV